MAGPGTEPLVYHAFSSEAAVTAGPVFADDLVIFGHSDGRLLALSLSGKPVWEFAAEGAIRADPAVGHGRLYFGTEDRLYYGLNARRARSSGPADFRVPPFIRPSSEHGILAVPGSNSVVYLLSGKGGSILSWEAVDSRIVYRLASAGHAFLLSSAAPGFTVLDARAGTRVWQYVASGSLAAGAVWSPPFVVLAVEDEGTAGQRLVFLGPALLSFGCHHRQDAAGEVS